MTSSRLSRGRSGAVQHQLARYFLTLQPGDRLKPVRLLARDLRTSVGSLSHSIRELERTGAVKIDRRGRIGSFLNQLSHAALWRLAEGGPLVIGLTLPSNPRFEGLATGLKKILTEAGIDVYLVFIRGSRTRFAALRENRCHVIVTSAFSAEHLSTRRERIVLELPPGSFVAGHCLYFQSRALNKARPLRVAIDRDSYDHASLAEMEFKGLDVKFVPIMSSRLERLLSDGQVDVSVWNSEEMHHFSAKDFITRPLSDAIAAKVGLKNTSAALVARADCVAAHAIISGLIHPEELMSIQGKVISGEMVPQY